MGKLLDSWKHRKDAIAKPEKTKKDAGDALKKVRAERSSFNDRLRASPETIKKVEQVGRKPVEAKKTKPEGSGSPDKGQRERERLR